MQRVSLDLGMHPRQLQAFESPATDILFGGATEGGKSYWLRCSLIVYCLEIANLQCTLIRKKYSDIRDNHLEGHNGFKAMLAPLVDVGRCEITQDEIRFWNGSRIYFLHCQDERQFDSAQGVERHVLAIDEATQISEKLIKFFRNWVRMPIEFKATIPEKYRDKFPLILQTANPIGSSVGYYRREYVKARPAEAIEPVNGFLRQYIPSRYTDNLSIEPEKHKGRMQNIEDEALRKALDEGSWDSLMGDFFPEWDESRHVIQDFTPPYHWVRYRTFDWGTADPAAVYWVAVSDGEPFSDSAGRRRWCPRGALVVYNEWYICDSTNQSKGARLRNEDIAEGIWQRTELHARNTPILTDSLPFQDRGGETIAQVFQRVFQSLGSSALLVPGDTSRIPGWANMRSRLTGIQIDSNDPRRTPMIYFTECCKFAREYIPMLMRHPSESKKEDAQEHGEATHACDAIRLACMAHTVVKDRKEPMESRIQKAILANRPSVKNVTRQDFRRFFA